MVITVLSGFLASCTSAPFIVANPPASKTKEAAEEKPPAAEPQKKTPVDSQKSTVSVTPSPETIPPSGEKAGNRDERDSIDFALAFRDYPAKELVAEAKPPVVSRPPEPAAGPKTVPVPRKMIRVALRQNLIRAVLYTMDSIEVRMSSPRAAARRCRGRLAVEKLGKSIIAVTVDSSVSFQAELPCTLSSVKGAGLINVEQESYRGSIILSGNGTMTIVNLVGVEEYLRGVVPLEIGRRNRSEIEALKAQAVAARTYAYKRIVDNRESPFDLLNTVADQVYGGADVETPETDLAVAATAGMVLTWRDSLADVFYHSTCGGRTAGIDDVWGKPYCEYLVSRSDEAPDGKAYCSFSSSFTWEESWDAGTLSNIVRTSSRQLLPNSSFAGKLEKITIEERFRCGRVKRCRIMGSGGSVECGGDKVRFILRRKGGEILRSANVSVVKNGPRRFAVRGSGYGHGVGMCQMGAVGRARQGQSCEQILKAYFSNVELRPVSCGTAPGAQ